MIDLHMHARMHACSQPFVKQQQLALVMLAVGVTLIPVSTVVTISSLLSEE